MNKPLLLTSRLTAQAIAGGTFWNNRPAPSSRDRRGPKSKFYQSMRVASLLVALLLLGRGTSLQAADAAEIYMLDVDLGFAIFVISPSGETMLLDTGYAKYAESVVLAFMKQKGLQKIDYLVVSHFHGDHFEGAPLIAEHVPILNWVDHGDTVETADWWKWRYPGVSPAILKREDFESYRKARAKGNHIVAKPGDRIPIKGLDAVVVSSGAKVLTRPMKGAPGAGSPNPACACVDNRPDEPHDGEGRLSVGVVITLGKFRFIDLGDLTYPVANRLFCPNNLVGTVDAYVITHHANSVPKERGDYYYGDSCCSPAEVHGLRPRVALLSLGAAGHKGGTPAAMEVVESSPGLENIWATEKIIAGGEAGHNPPDDYIARLSGSPNDKLSFIKLVARPDGSFTVSNSRNGFRKDYAARK
jgi:competence protein ComEC